MSTQLSNFVGYRGLVKLNDKTVLATSGDIQMNNNLMKSTGVWGAGYKNGAETVAWSNNRRGVHRWRGIGGNQEVRL